MLSIDQNCHSLWDALPKLHAVRAAGRPITHCIEDIDVAFTALGAGRDDAGLEIVRERYHRSGGQDWGAALFYSEFLGTLPTEVREFEPLTGMKTAALAKQTGRSVDDLYDAFSPGDNWQLIGPSYVGDRRHHRVIGDLGAAETAPFVMEILDRARADLHERFVDADSRERIDAWFDGETRQVEAILARRGDRLLVDVYRDWMRLHLGDDVPLDLTSDLFSLSGDPRRHRLLDLFVRDYDRLSTLYNRAIEETGVGLRPLRRGDGELPFFATMRHEGHWVRVAAQLDGDHVLVADRRVPAGRDLDSLVAGLRAAEVCCMAGKALVLVLQVREGEAAQPLALPFQGSVYMPAAHRLGRLLQQEGLLGPLQPIVRVRLHLLDRMKGLSTRVRLPRHLASAAGAEVVAADEIARSWRQWADAARSRLERLKSDEGRQAWQEQAMADLHERIAQLDARRLEIVKQNPKDPEARALWAGVREAKAEILERTLQQIAQDRQVAAMDVWDSRGAILPWAIALGGKTFYDGLIRDAELYEEHPEPQSP